MKVKINKYKELVRRRKLRGKVTKAKGLIVSRPLVSEHPLCKPRGYFVGLRSFHQIATRREMNRAWSLKYGKTAKKLRFCFSS